MESALNDNSNNEFDWRATMLLNSKLQELLLTSFTQRTFFFSVTYPSTSKEFDKFLSIKISDSSYNER